MKVRRPMASNETIAEIVSDMRVYAKNSKVNGGEVDVWNWLANYADRIEAAHKRERKAGAEAAQIVGEIGEMIGREAAGRQPVTDCNRLGNVAKDDERLTIVAIYENVIAAKDREIAELRERIKVAEYALTELQTRLVSSVYDGTMNPYEALEITERAIAAISEKGGAK